MSSGRGIRWPVALLVAQTVLFGAMAALVGVVANAMFLDAYGSGWLPATYVAIGAVGVAVSGGIARSAQRYRLATISLVVLGGAATGMGAAWLLARGGEAPWVAIPLLVLFPVLIQLGFVFVGAQAGRILDIAGLKSYFPRIMAGFPVGAVAGSLAGAQLVDVLGRTEELLLAAALVQAAFAALAWITARRAERTTAGRSTAGAGEPSPGARDLPDSQHGLRRLLASRFVLLLMGYQVLSALGSQLADYLVYDRAAVRFPDPADLAQFLALYTAAMNVASIGFLVIVAAPLLRRFGLRLGIPANPVALGAFSVLMVAAWAVAGPASTALLIAVSAGRIADIALTDGTTRSSLQIAYQAVPERTRLAVQTAIEGMGVPLAIALSGALILGLGLLPDPLLATLLATVATCAVWSWIAVLLYRAYGPALVGSLRRRRLLEPDAALELEAGDRATAARLASGSDPRAARLGVDLLLQLGSGALPGDLARMVVDPRLGVRLAARTSLARLGDPDARQHLANDVREASSSGAASLRILAARGLGPLEGADRELGLPLLRDPAPSVRIAALESVAGGDGFALDAVLDALEDPRTAGAAGAAADRLGDMVVPALADRLAETRVPATRSVARLVRSFATHSPARDTVLREHLGHPDRELGLLLARSLTGAQPADPVAARALDALLDVDLLHAGRLLAALEATSGRDGARQAGVGDPTAPALAPLRRAIVDELALVRERVLAGRLARHGRDALGPAIEAARGHVVAPVAIEALRVMLGADHADAVLALVDTGVNPAERARRLPQPADSPSGREGWLQDLVEDPHEHWRSPWLRACAVRAARLVGVLGTMDLGPARAAGDPVVDEELAVSGAC